MSLVKCDKCGRNFNQKTLSVHYGICRGSSNNQPNNQPNIYDDNEPFQSHEPVHSNGPSSNFVVCETCGKTFTIHSIALHRPKCLEKAQREKAEIEAQQRHDAGPKGPVGFPGVTCYICGRKYGSKSIELHEKNCLDKFRKENAQLPKKEQRPEPIKPKTNKEYLEERVKENKLAGNAGYNIQDAMNDVNAEAYNKNLVPCKICGRTFNPDALKFHTKACTKKHASRRVGEETGYHHE